MAPEEQSFDEFDELAVNTIRTLAIDAIQKANSGHPGTPMALAPVAYVLWQRFLRFDPAQPIWPNRDRFVLSAGHASMLLYALLHLAGVRAVDSDYEVEGRESITLDDIKSFRQLDSKAAGHPEYRWASGVETTTGPLGQGVATSVGMAVASKWQGAHFNRPGFELFDFDTYVICGDGDLMEGVSHEAGSFAGHQRLDNLCWIYDSNRISIDGDTEITYEDDVARRFEAYGWNVTTRRRREQLRRDHARARRLQGDRGPPDPDHRRQPHRLRLAAQAGHGRRPRRAARRRGGARDEALLRLARGCRVPRPRRGPRALRRGHRRPRRRAQRRLAASLVGYEREHESLERQIGAMQRRELPDGWDRDIPSFEADEKGIATRKASNQVQNAIAANVPWLLSGSADLTDSTSVRLDEKLSGGDFQPDNRAGRQLHYGIREHESAAISNGLSLSKLRPSWSTYLTFSDYARPAIRLSALMEIPVIHIFTHDSIGLGEDGPTHQPVEQLASLRAVPGLNVIRPCDANEVAEAWRVIMEADHLPTALVLTRQDVPVIDRTRYAGADGLRRGGYVLADADGGDPELILVATGWRSRSRSRRTRSWPPTGSAPASSACRRSTSSTPRTQAYRDSVLPPSVTARISIEEASTLGWDRYVGADGERIGMHTFGSSAPLKDVLTEFGFTPEKVVETAKAMLSQ